MDVMDNYVKQEVAIDLLIDRIAKTMKELENSNDEKLKEKLELLLEARTKVYSGDEKMIERVLNEKDGE